MNRLIKSGLYGGGLFPITTSVLVSRYNAGLTALGLTPTQLKTFKVDAVGWSPEIAKEQDDLDYLSLDEVSRSAIIVTPEQNGLPVYRPVHSFDRPAVEHLFHGAKTQIADLTGTTSLWANFAPEISRFKSPLDLFTVDWIDIIVGDMKGIIPGAREQRELVAHFLGDDNAPFDGSLRKRIQGSAESFGDLRFRSVIIPKLKFTDVRSFYTRAFDGSYVFRDVGKVQQLLILERKLGKPVCSSKEVPIFDIDAEQLPSFLEEQQVVDISLGWYRQSCGLARIERLLNYLLADAFYRTDDEREFQDLGKVPRKSWIAKHETEIGPIFFELEKLLHDLRQVIPDDELEISDELRPLLFRPSKSALESEVISRVVWHLIARLSPFDVERLFVANKPRFYALYSKWSKAKQKWAVRELLERQHPQPPADAWASAVM